jgi:hypothetical protein
MAAWRPRYGAPSGGRIGGGGIGRPLTPTRRLGLAVDPFAEATAGASSQERAALERKRQEYARQLRAQGYSSAVAGASARIFAGRQQQGVGRTMSVLGAIGRGLGAIEQAGAGYMRGFAGALGKGKDPFTAMGYGLAAAPGAVRKQYGYGELVMDIDPKETTAAGRFIHEHAGPIGFGMALLFDPTMYLSFGATSASKQAAYGALRLARKESQDQAEKIMARGGANRGVYFGNKFDDIDDLTNFIHRTEGRPFTLNDALSNLRTTGKEYKAAARRGRAPGGRVTRPMRVAAAYALPTNIQGGRGLRFAGMEVPGTPRLGRAIGAKRRQVMGRAVRPGAEGRMIPRGFGQMFVTGQRLKLIEDDMERAMALGRFADMKTAYRRARKGAAQTVGEVVARTTEEGRPGVIPEAERMGALREDDQILMFRGDPDAVDQFAINRAEPNAAVGRGLYLTESREVANTFAESRWGFMGMLDDPKTQGVVSTVSVPKSVLARTYDTSESMTPEIRNAADDVLEEIKNQTIEGRARETNPVMREKARADIEELSHLQRVLRDPEEVDDLYELGHMLPEEGINWREQSGNWGESFWEDSTDIFWEGMKDRLAPMGYRGFKYPTKREGRLAYEELANKVVPDNEYSLWDDVEFNDLIRGEHPEQKLPELRTRIEERVNQEIADAKKWGLSAKTVRNDWEELVRDTDDPAIAIGEFVFRNRSQIIMREFIDQFLTDTMFAKPVGKDIMSAQIPKGRVLYTHPVTRQKYSVMGEIANALEEVANPVVVEKGIESAIRIANIPQNFWKQFATLPNPSFHVMNFLGAIWNNMLGALYNPADYIDAISTVYRAKIEERALTGRRTPLGRPAVSTARTREAAQTVEELEARGALGSVSIFAELGQDTELKKILGETTPKSVKRRLIELGVPREGESMKRFALRQARRTTAVGLAATANPLALAALAPELVRAGRAVSSAMEDVVRIAPFMKASKDPVLKQYLHAYGPVTIPGNKHPSFSKGEQKAMYDIAAEMTRQFQFDYTDLTNFERLIAKTIFPFYTFYRKNFVLQTKMLFERPRQTVAALTAINYLNENSDVSDHMQEMLPDYFENIQAVAMPVPDAIRRKLGLPLTEPLFLNPKLPFLSINMMPPVWDVFRDTGQPTKQKVLAAFAPMTAAIGPWAPVPVPGMKTVFEAATGEVLGLNKTIDYQRAQSNDWRNSWVPAPAWAKYLPEPVRDFMGMFPWMDIEETPKGEFIMTATGQYILDVMSTPFVTNLGQAIPVGGPGYEGEKAKADLVSWMTGIRLMPVDTLRMHRSWGYRMKSMLESEKADLEDRGERMEPQDMMTLRLVRRQLEVLERAWDRRQDELGYGQPPGRR